MTGVGCPNCGVPAPQGARFCRACGTTLPAAAPPTETMRAEPAPPQPPRPDRTRRLVAAAIAALIVLAAIGGGVGYLVTRDSGDDERADAPAPPAQTTEAPPAEEDPRLGEEEPAPAPEGLEEPPTEEEALDVLDEYSAVYETADEDRLVELFTDDFERRPGDGSVQDAEEAREEYASQFEQFEEPSYELSDEVYTPAEDAAAVRARYRIESGGERVGGGSIRFVIVREGEALKIAKISIRRD